MGVGERPPHLPFQDQLRGRQGPGPCSDGKGGSGHRWEQEASEGLSQEAWSLLPLQVTWPSAAKAGFSSVSILSPKGRPC